MPTIWVSVGTIKDGAVSGIPGAPNPDTDIPSGGGAAIDDSAISYNSTWSSQNTVDKLCPAIAEGGAVVQCEPVEGYPLDVTTVMGNRYASKLTLTQCGKNLLNYSPLLNYGGISEINGVLSSTISALYSYTKDGTLKSNAFADGEQYVFSAYVKKDSTPNATPYLCLMYTDGSSKSARIESTGIMELVAVVSDPGKTVAYPFFTYGDGGSCVVSIKNMQVERGTTVTDYEPYIENTYTVDFGKKVCGEYNWKTGVFFDSDDTLFYYQYHEDTGEFEYLGHTPGTFETHTVRNIPAHKGVNTLFSDKGNTQVIGKADPVAVIDKLTKAIIALGGNV
jgi:hypothetical protein